MVTNAKRLRLALTLLVASASAFAPSTHVALGRSPLSISRSSAVDSPCECGNAAVVSGSPSAEARAVDPKQALSESTAYRLDGSPVSVSSLMANEGVSLIVLTRSFG